MSIVSMQIVLVPELTPVEVLNIASLVESSGKEDEGVTQGPPFKSII
jgi:hypothetical protein